MNDHLIFKPFSDFINIILTTYKEEEEKTHNDTSQLCHIMEFNSFAIYINHDDNLSGQGKLTIVWKDTSNTYKLVRTSTISLDTWYHLVFFKSGNNAATQGIYINGSKEEPGGGLTASGNWVSAYVDVEPNVTQQDITLGAYNGFNVDGAGAADFFNGYIDDFRIYLNSALTDANITSIVNNLDRNILIPFSPTNDSLASTSQYKTGKNSMIFKVSFFK